MSSNSNPPLTYRHMPLRDRPANAPTADPYNHRSYHAGHPLALFNTVLPPPQAAQDMSTALAPSPIRRLRTPLVLADPRSTTDLGRAADLSTHTNDQYRYDRPALSHSKEQPSTPRPLLLADANNIVNNAPNSTPFPHLSASEPQCCKISPVMQHHETQKSLSLIRKIITGMILASALTTAQISSHRHPPPHVLLSYPTTTLTYSQLRMPPGM
jgi:hypothetical protein